MDKLYDGEFFESTIRVLQDNLRDLALWSVYNKDAYLDEISNIQRWVEELKEEK